MAIVQSVANSAPSYTVAVIDGQESLPRAGVGCSNPEAWDPHSGKALTTPITRGLRAVISLCRYLPFLTSYGDAVLLLLYAVAGRSDRAAPDRRLEYYAQSKDSIEGSVRGN